MQLNTRCRQLCRPQSLDAEIQTTNIPGDPFLHPRNVDMKSPARHESAVPQPESSSPTSPIPPSPCLPSVWFSVAAQNIVDNAKHTCHINESKPLNCRYDCRLAFLQIRSPPLDCTRPAVGIGGSRFRSASEAFWGSSEKTVRRTDLGFDRHDVPTSSVPRGRQLDKVIALGKL